jgi:uncharacterized protein (DUF302 family)
MQYGVRQMSFYMAKSLRIPFDDAVARAKEALASEGFGVLTDIDVRATLKSKLNVDWKPYRILGACNPPLAHQALIAEDKIGTMLPCNIVIHDVGNGETEVAAVDPLDTMIHIGNPELTQLARAVRSKLRSVLDRL